MHKLSALENREPITIHTIDTDNRMHAVVSLYPA